MVKDRRRYRRHEAAIKASLVVCGRAQALTTTDVSRHGVFLLTDSPKSERQLVRLTFDLPDGPLDVMGMVARSVPAAEAPEDAKPGMGIDFFALSREAKDRWDAYVLGVPDGAEAPTDAPEATRRRHPRHVSCFLVRLKDRHRLRDYYSRDISGGGTLLRTPSPNEVSAAVEMILVHPETDAEFTLSGKVVRVVQSDVVRQRGVAIEFHALDRKREAALLSFIETGVVFLEEHSPEVRAERIELLRRATELAPESPLPLAALGQALVEVDQVSSAIQAFERSLAVDPDCMAAHRGLYEAYTAIEAYGRAHKHLVILRRHEKIRD